MSPKDIPFNAENVIVPLVEWTRKSVAMSTFHW